jgi:putative transferase (TIGR04331 family)
VLEYCQDQVTFLRALDSNVRDRLRVRPHPLTLGWDEKERILKTFPEIRVVGDGELMSQSVEKSCLVIQTCDSTTFLETFTANIPTILCLSRRFWESRSSAIPFFDQLRSAGVLYDTPESAAAAVSKVARDPVGWWEQSGVQAAVKSFCDRFAKVDADWLSRWRTELRQLQGIEPCT